MKKLYSTENRVLLYLLRSKCNEQGIQTLIKNEEPPAGGEITSAVAWPELWIMNDSRYLEALDILQEELARNLRPKKSWQCTHCGEKLGGQFDICWKCGNSRE